MSTRVLTPKQAVAWAAFFNFAAFIFFGTKVAETISQVAKPGTFSNAAIAAALLGAIGLDLITWLDRLPTSSSHALVGGLAGAAVASVGWSSLNFAEYQKIIVFIVIAPVMGFLLAFTFMAIVFWAVPPVPEGRQAEPGVPSGAAVLGGRVLASATGATTRRRRWASS